jgi:hypothetical protein
MMSEHDEQVTLFSILALYEDKHPELKWIFAIPNGGKRHPATAVKMKAEGVKAGVWDLFIPVAVDEHCGMFIEMKFGKNHLTDNQVEFNLDVGNAYKWMVCYSAIEACHAIGEYLGIDELKEVQ